MRHFRAALAGLPLDGEVTAHVETLLHISTAYRSPLPPPPTADRKAMLKPPPLPSRPQAMLSNAAAKMQCASPTKGSMRRSACLHHTPLLALCAQSSLPDNEASDRPGQPACAPRSSLAAFEKDAPRRNAMQLQRARRLEAVTPQLSAQHYRTLLLALHSEAGAAHRAVMDARYAERKPFPKARGPERGWPHASPGLAVLAGLPASVSWPHARSRPCHSLSRLTFKHQAVYPAVQPYTRQSLSDHLRRRWRRRPGTRCSTMTRSWTSSARMAACPRSAPLCSLASLMVCSA